MSCQITLDLGSWEIIVSRNRFFASNLLQAPLNRIPWINLITMRPLTQYQPKIRAIKLQKSAKFCLT